MAKKFTKHDFRDIALLDTSLSPSSFRLLCVLLMHRNDHTRRCNPGGALLCGETGLKERALSNCLKQLKAKGYVDWLKGAPGRSNRYWFAWLDDPPILPKSKAKHPQKSADDHPQNNAGDEARHPQETADGTGTKLPTNTLTEHRAHQPSAAPAPSEPDDLWQSGDPGASDDYVVDSDEDQPFETRSYFTESRGS